MRAEHFLFDWGGTLMRVFAGAGGPMCGWKRVEATAHAADVLARLTRNTRCHLATNAEDSEPEQIRLALERVGLAEYVTEIFCLRSVGSPKPSRRFFARVVAELETTASRVVMVGDDLNADVRGALAAGLRAVWYNPGNERVPRGIRAITDLRELEP